MPEATPPASGALSAFPRRPLRPLPPIGRGWSLGTLLGLVLFAGLLVFSVGWDGPVVVTDWLVRGVAVPIAGGHIENGRCSGHLFLQTCDVDLLAPLGSGTISRTVHYAFGSFHEGSFTARVVADPGRPQWLTTDLGLDRFWNRVVMLVVTCVLLVAAILASIRGMVRAARVHASWRRAAMVPVPLRLVGIGKAGSQRVWTVRADSGKQARWTVPARARPFVLGPDERVLGLMIEGGGSIMPLDAALRWVELSGAERSAVLAARTAG